MHDPSFGVLTLIQARHGSSRLPGKALRKINGKPILHHVIERAQAIGWPVMVATSVNKRDDGIVKLATKLGVGVFRGDEADVLGRMSKAAEHARIVIRVTGDCPLLAPDVATEVFRLYVGGGDVIATNDTTCSGWPDGMDVEVFQAAALHEAAEKATDPADREHVTKWIRRHRQHVIYQGPTDPPNIKLSIDTEADFQRVSGIFQRLGGDFGYRATFAAIPDGKVDNVEVYDVALPPKAIAALKREGLTPAGAKDLSDEELLAIKGIGQATVERLRGGT